MAPGFNMEGPLELFNIYWLYTFGQNDSIGPLYINWSIRDFYDWIGSASQASYHTILLYFLQGILPITSVGGWFHLVSTFILISRFLMNTRECERNPKKPYNKILYFRNLSNIINKCTIISGQCVLLWGKRAMAGIERLIPIPSAAKYLMRRGFQRPKYFMRVEPC